MRKQIGIAAIAILLAGCSAFDSKQSGGTLIGAGAGAMLGAGVAGNSVVGAGLGAVAGGIAGNVIGKSMDDSDRRRYRY